MVLLRCMQHASRPGTQTATGSFYAQSIVWHFTREAEGSCIYVKSFNVICKIVSRWVLLYSLHNLYQGVLKLFIGSSDFVFCKAWRKRVCLPDHADPRVFN